MEFIDMTPKKRVFDVIISILLLVVFLPILLVLVILLLIFEGRPLLYVSERMHSPSLAFPLMKFRTMAAAASNGGVTGGDKVARISRFHRIMRRSRLDEIPQLWNVIVGHMSLVGPRPPLRVYVEDYPELYAAVLQNRPGITGLASLRFFAHEERILAQATTAAQTDRAYRDRSIPRKARLDLIYQTHASLCFDFALLIETAAKPFKRY
jgi:lipopolysaccharide/colanic/teichoic acid biosynthesis glycosyltransferase